MALVEETCRQETGEAELGAMLLIAPCFERVLGLSGLSWDDDFFACGGDSVAAVDLALQIQDAFGVPMPMTAAFDAPSIRAMARFAVARRTAETGAPILLKPGGQGCPVYLLPGASGVATGLRQLAGALVTESAIYGFDYPGLGGRGRPLDSVSDFADHFLPRLLSLHGTGPMILGGYSAGGLVAYEMACRLAAQGNAPVLLILIDCIVARRHYTWQETVRIWRRRAAVHVRVMRGLDPSEALRHGAARAPHILRDIVPRKSALIVHEGSVSDAAALAAHRYAPPRYDGKTALLWSEADAEHNALDIVWHGRARNLMVYELPGSHATALTANLQDTARILSQIL